MRLRYGSRRRFFISSSSSSDPDGTRTVAAAAANSALTCDSGINSLWEQLIVFLTHVTERTSPSSKTHHTGLWNVLLSRPSAHLSSCMSRGNPTCRFYLRYMQICSNRCYVFLCFSFWFLFFLPVQINTLCRFERTRSHTQPSSPETLGNAPHCGPTSWPSLAQV